MGTAGTVYRIKSQWTFLQETGRDFVTQKSFCNLWLESIISKRKNKKFRVELYSSLLSCSPTVQNVYFLIMYVYQQDAQNSCD